MLKTLTARTSLLSLSFVFELTSYCLYVFTYRLQLFCFQCAIFFWFSQIKTDFFIWFFAIYLYFRFVFGFIFAPSLVITLFITQVIIELSLIHQSVCSVVTSPTFLILYHQVLLSTTLFYFLFSFVTFRYIVGYYLLPTGASHLFASPTSFVNKTLSMIFDFQCALFVFSFTSIKNIYSLKNFLRFYIF